MERSEIMKNFKTAIVDIGSNTIRVVMYTYNQDKGLHEFGNIKTVARLRTHLLPTGEMSEEGMQILEDTLLSFKEILQDYNVTDVKACATAAVRQATNNKEIVRRMKDRTGITIDILSEEEEAYFGYLAVVYSMDTPSAVTIDIGGGSTEITLYKNKKLQETHSFPFGTVSLMQKFVKGDSMNEKERRILHAFITEQFKSLSWLKNAGLPIVAIGGSARNVAQIHQQQIDYPISGVHQYEMHYDELVDLKEQLSLMSLETLKQLDGLSSDRADIIVPAIEVFTTLMEVVDTTSFQLSKKGLREGLIIKRVLQTDKGAFDKYNVFQENGRRIAAAYGRSAEEASTLCALADKVYKGCCKLKFFEYNENKYDLLMNAAKVYSVGEYIELDSSSQHTFYLLANQSISGMTHIERIKLALIASYKNRDYFRRFAAPFTAWLTREELRELRDLGALLKFVYALNVSKRNIVKDVRLEEVNGKVRIYVKASDSAVSEKYQAERTKKHIERIFKQEVDIYFE